jgi:hypothetical protein
MAQKNIICALTWLHITVQDAMRPKYRSFSATTLQQKHSASHRFFISLNSNNFSGTSHAASTERHNRNDDLE